MSSPSPISCTNCGYALEGIAEDAKCPECAFPIQNSLASRKFLSSSIPNPHRTANRLSLLGTLQSVAALWLCLFPLHVASGGRPFRLIDTLSLTGMFAFLLLWLAIELAWFLVCRTIVERESTSAATFLKVCCWIPIFSMPISVGSGTAAFSNQDGFLLAFALGLGLIATLASLLGTLPIAFLLMDVNEALPRNLQTRRLNWLALLLLWCSAAAVPLYLSYSSLYWVSILIPVGAAASSFRSFALARRIRAAIGEP